jgi:endonuclease G, mitochondrial
MKSWNRPADASSRQIPSYVIKDKVREDYLRRIADVDGITADDLMNLRQEPGLEASGFAISDELIESWEDFRLGKPITDSQRVGIEAIVLPNGLRPVFDVHEGTFRDPPSPWAALSAHKPFLERCIRAVGRVDVEGGVLGSYVGSAFVISNRALVTNRHVVELFALGAGDTLTFKPGMSPFVDFRQEIGTTDSLVVRLVGSPVISQDWDAALLFVNDGALDGITAIPLAGSAPPTPKERLAAVVGYPALTPSDNVQNVLQQLQIFRSVFEKKRLQPGRLIGIRPTKSYGRQVQSLAHDCTTLGGNSGSALIDVERECVTGLHFRGDYLDANYAVPTWELIGSFFDTHDAPAEFIV